MNRVRYVFVLIDAKGHPDTWGYRSTKKAAKKRMEELQGWIKDRKTMKGYKVECYKVISTETRHPVDF